MAQVEHLGRWIVHTGSVPPHAAGGNCFLFPHVVGPDERVIDLGIEVDDIAVNGTICISETAVRELAAKCIGMLDGENSALARVKRELKEVREQLAVANALTMSQRQHIYDLTEQIVDYVAPRRAAVAGVDAPLLDGVAADDEAEIAAGLARMAAIKALTETP